MDDNTLDAVLFLIGEWMDDHFGQYVEDSAGDLLKMIKEFIHDLQ